jgi:hypothetical protein
MGNVCDSLMNEIEIDEPIRVGNGNKARVTKKEVYNGDLPDVWCVII